jgi:hypothetical protein
MTRRTLTPGRHARRSGFALLLEIIVALFVVGLLARAYFSSLPERIMAERIAAEDAALKELALAIHQSLLSTDLSGTNIAALDGEIGPTDTPTIFSTSTRPAYASTARSDWFAKLATLHGTGVLVGTPPAPDVQPELSRLLYNSMNQSRLLFLRPSVRPEHVQLLLVSLLATPEQLVLPDYVPSDAWFDAIWNHDFSKRTLTVPAAWIPLLTAEQVTAWNSGRGGSNLNRLRVVRITIPKFAFHVNNNDATNYGWVYWNNGGQRFEARPESGATTTPPIISGRVVKCTSGVTEANASINYLSPLQSSGSFTVK